MNVYTIGFTKKNAEVFFGMLRQAGVKKLLDVRLNNVSQLAGFAKKDDLRFFLKELCGAEYLYVPEMTPTKDILASYKDGKIKWADYEQEFLNLMAKRHLEKSIKPELLDHACLLCSEHEPHMCHRRLVVEYLKDTAGIEMTVKHLY